MVLEPETWREALEVNPPDLLLCESAWTGADGARKPWRGQVYSSVRFGYENRKALLEILRYCRAKSIPTVFWNKEDPTHHHDRINDFVDTASRFDYILTTAAECVPSYQKFHPRDAVGVLPFAVQERLFNPLPLQSRSERVVFAGGWYGVHPGRQESMRAAFSTVLASKFELEIFDRGSDIDDPGRRYPDEYAKLVRQSVAYEKTADLYRSSAGAISINTVTDSSTMCARRLFEIAATGTLVIANDTPAVRHFMGDNALLIGSDGGALAELDELTISKMRLGGLESVLGAHTYRDRWEQILDHVGLPFQRSDDRPVLAVAVRTRGEAEEALATWQRQRDGFRSLALVIPPDVPSEDVGAYYADFARPGCDVYSLRLLEMLGDRLGDVAEGEYFYFVRPEDLAKVSASEASRLKAHARYCAQPIGWTGGVQLGWGATATSQVLVRAGDLASLFREDAEVLPALEVPRW